MNTIHALFCILILAFFCAASEQTSALSIDLDGAIFQYDKDHMLWEVYYAYPDTMVTYQRKENGYVGELYMAMEIRSQTKTMASQQWIASNVKDTLGGETVSHLIGAKQFVLPPGQYSVYFTIADAAHMQDTARLRDTVQLIIPTPGKERLDLSHIELASHISVYDSADPNNPAFVKNQLVVVPNPTLTYADTIPVLQYYTEIYNARKFAPEGINVRCDILDASRRIVFSSTKKRNSNTDAMLEYGIVRLDSLPSGLYYLHLTVTGAVQSSDSIASLKKFYILNPLRAPVLQTFSEGEEFQKSEFSTMLPEMVQDELEKIRPIAFSQERELADKLTENLARQKFLFYFWKSRDPDLNTPINERREEFQKAIDFANRFYSSMQTREGWRSDRGRVLRQYGFADHINESNYATEGRAYVTWTYSQVQGGVDFVFVDISGYGNYVLVHSTAQSESRNADWYTQYVQVAGMQSNGK